MSFGLPLVECIYCVGCSRWAWKRCTYTGNDDSQNWTVATTEEFETVPRICRLILAVYEEDLRNPKWPPKGGYRINPDWVIKKVSYKVTLGNAPPYLIYLDHDAHDIVLAIRGLNLAKNSDYAVLLDNRSEQMFDGGYVHHGLLRSAVWLHKQEKETLIELTQGNPSYTLTFAGHSLGSGVAALLTMVVAKHPEQLGNISRKRLRCYAVAPARCMSLNLAVKYADVINSVILQDDFLPRTATPLEDIFKSVFCLPCLLCVRCMKDTCLSEERRLQDPKRFYAPGRLYHIVDRKPRRCGRYPPEVRTAIPVSKRFEHIILSCNATQDHAIIWIEKEAQKAVDRMMEKEKPMEIPPEQRMERKQSIVKGHEEEHKTALERAQSLNIPHAYSPPHSDKNGNNSEKPLVRNDRLPSSSEITESSAKNEVQAQRTDWDDLLKRLFEKDAGGKLVLKEGSP